MKNIIIISTILVLGSTLEPAKAQILVDPIWSPADMMALNNIRTNPVVNRIINNGQRSESPDSLQSKKAMAMSFFPDETRRKKNLANFVLKTRGTNPAQANSMEQLFSKYDIIGEGKKLLSPVGLRVDNVADTYAAYWLMAWKIRHSDRTPISSTQALSTKNRITDALWASPKFLKATADHKQEMAEALIVQITLMNATSKAFSDDPDAIKKLSLAARQNAKVFGLDLDAVTLTERGFVSSKR